MYFRLPAYQITARAFPFRCSVLSIWIEQLFFGNLFFPTNVRNTKTIAHVRNFVIVEESTQYDPNNSSFSKIDVSRNLKEYHRTPDHETKRNAWSTNAKQRGPWTARGRVTHFPSRTRETLSSPDNSKKPQLLRRRFRNTMFKRWSRRLAGYTRLTTTKPRPSGGVVKWCNRPVSVACAFLHSTSLQVSPWISTEPEQFLRRWICRSQTHARVSALTTLQLEEPITSLIDVSVLEQPKT